MGLRQRLLDVVLGDLPTSESVLEEPNLRWDELLGGRKGPGQWGRFGTGAGTTCVIILDGWAIDAGFPEEMIIRHDTPTGGGVPILQAMYKGATARGWLKTPTRGQIPDLRPGDVYVSDHATKDGSSGTHVGVVVAVTPSADGQSLEVQTADGGQGTREHQSAGRRTRTFSLSTGPHAVMIHTPNVGDSWLDRWIAVGGDESLDVPQDPAVGGGGASGAPPGADGGSVAALALGALGLALVVGGIAWVASSSSGGARTGSMFALRGAHDVLLRDLQQVGQSPTLSQAERDGVAWAVATIRSGVGDVRDLDRRWSEQHYDGLQQLFKQHKQHGLSVEQLGALMEALTLLGENLGRDEQQTRGRFNALRDVTVNLKPSARGVDDYSQRERYLDLLGDAGFEVTGFGGASTLGGRPLGADVSVVVDPERDEARLRELAQRAGVTVADVRAWR